MEKVFKPMLLKEDFFPILEIPVIMEEETKGTTINIKAFIKRFPKRSKIL
jgi:hypothetical protein